MGWKISVVHDAARETDKDGYALYTFKVTYEGEPPEGTKKVGLVLSVDHVTTESSDGVYLQSTDNKDANGNIIYSNATSINKTFSVDDLDGEHTFTVRVRGDDVKEAHEIFAIEAKTEYYDKGAQPVSGKMIKEKAYALVMNDDPKYEYPDEEAAWKEALEDKTISPSDRERIGIQLEEKKKQDGKINYEEELEETFFAQADAFDFEGYQREKGDRSDAPYSEEEGDQPEEKSDPGEEYQGDFEYQRYASEAEYDLMF